MTGDYGGAVGVARREEENIIRRLGHPPPFFSLGLRVRGGWRFFLGSGGGTSAAERARMFVSSGVLWASLVSRVCMGRLPRWVAFLSVCRGAAGFGFSLSFSLVGRRIEHASPF